MIPKPIDDKDFVLWQEKETPPGTSALRLASASVYLLRPREDVRLLCVGALSDCIERAREALG